MFPTFKRFAVGGRTFQVSGSRMWKELPEDVATAPSLPIFRRQLKSEIIFADISLVHIVMLVT